jgi:hypothetical protein
VIFSKKLPPFLALAYILSINTCQANDALSADGNLDELNVESLNATIGKLVHSLPFKKAAVESILGIKLRVLPEDHPSGSDREYYSEKLKERSVSNAHLIEYAAPTKTAQGILSIYFNDDHGCVTEKIIRARYGKPTTEMSGAIADIPQEGQPKDLWYERPWGNLIFGVDKKGNHCLKDVCIQAVVQPRLTGDK